jgi:putative flippase GtrA
MSTFKIEGIKFAVVGGVNFFLTFIIFTVTLKFFGLNHLISLGSAWIAGVFFSYVFNFSWVFKPEEKIAFKGRFLRYFFASLFSLVLNMVTLNYLVESTKIDAFYIQTALTPLIVVFNFVTARFWSLKPRNV